MSDNTRNFYGREPGRVEERYMANVLGTFRAAVEEHRVLTVINDWNLNPADLAPYKVLILANTACLDDAQVAAVARFVERGRRAGRQPRCLAVRRIRQPSRRTSPWRASSGSSTAGTIAEPRRASREPLDVNFAQVHRARLLGEAQERLRLQAGRRLVPQPRPDADLRGRHPRHLQGAGRAGRGRRARPRRSSARCG